MGCPGGRRPQPSPADRTGVGKASVGLPHPGCMEGTAYSGCGRGKNRSKKLNLSACFFKSARIIFLFCTKKDGNKMKRVLYIVRFTKRAKKVEKSLRIKWKNRKQIRKNGIGRG